MVGAALFMGDGEMVEMVGEVVSMEGRKEGWKEGRKEGRKKEGEDADELLRV